MTLQILGPAVRQSYLPISQPYALSVTTNVTDTAIAFLGLSEYAHADSRRSRLLKSGDYDVYKNALRAAASRFCVPTPVQPLELWETGSHLKTNELAGWNYGVSTRIGECIEYVFDSTQKLINRMKRKKKKPSSVRFPLCFVTKQSGQVLGWTYPIEVRICEKMFLTPLLRELKDIPDGSLTFAEAASVPAFVIYDIFDILCDNISFSRRNGVPVPHHVATRWKNVYHNMVWFFIHASLVMPDGRVYRKSHGLTPGSEFYSLINSFVTMMCAGGKKPWLPQRRAKVNTANEIESENRLSAK